MACLLLAGCGGQTSSSPSATAPILVETAPAALETLRRTLTLTGVLQAPEAAVVVSQAEGDVVAILVREGALIAAGTPLLALDDAVERAALASARAAQEQALREFAARRELAERGLISGEELARWQSACLQREAELQAAERRWQERTLRAPFSGVLGLRQVAVGDRIAAGTPVFTIAQPGRARLIVAVPERYAARVGVGQPLFVRLPAHPEQRWETTVAALDASLDPRTRTLAVCADLSGLPPELRPGASALVELVIETVPDAVTVPEAAIVVHGERASVWRVRGEVCERVPVQLGLRAPGRVQVLGLPAGSEVVVRGQHALRDGRPVQRRNAR
ncbi:MAG: efflux RND transporter periplasmic adaptor subunit [Planctomycetota bacterium]|nr:efflux RND transporter periplasmic adaptor subunit [Planctomycetota bacterium]MDW8372650.1 efflux RND transporter periplasmic adaptor subunit [Planctomycetota bacterium]